MSRLHYRVRRAVIGSALFGAGLTGLVGGGGCVEREMTIDSEPRGALVYLNDQEIGRTPLTKEFTWYGTYDAVVRLEGYETVKEPSPVIAPWWQWVPFDLLAELIPLPLKDRHELKYTLKPVTEQGTDPERLVRRGVRMRERLESGEKATTAPATSRPGK